MPPRHSNGNKNLYHGQNPTLLLKEHFEKQNRWEDRINLLYVRSLLEANADLYDKTIQALVFDRINRIQLDELKLYLSFDKKRHLIQELLIRYGAAFPYRAFEISHIKLLLTKFSPNSKDIHGRTIFMNVLMEARVQNNFEYIERKHLDVWIANKTDFLVTTPTDLLLLYITEAQWTGDDAKEVSKITKFLVETGIDPGPALRTFYKKDWEKVVPTTMNSFDDLSRKRKYVFLKSALQGIEDGLIARGLLSGRELEKLNLPIPIAHDIASRASVGLLTSPRQKSAASQRLKDALAKSVSNGGCSKRLQVIKSGSSRALKAYK